MSQKEQVCSEQSICFLPALGTVPLSSPMVYVTVLPPAIIAPLLLSVVCRHCSLPTFFLQIFGSFPPPPPDFEHQKSISPLQSRNMGISPFALSSWNPVSIQPRPRLGSGKPLAAEETFYIPGDSISSLHAG